MVAACSQPHCGLVSTGVVSLLAVYRMCHAHCSESHVDGSLSQHLIPRITWWPCAGAQHVSLQLMLTYQRIHSQDKEQHNAMSLIFEIHVQHSINPWCSEQPVPLAPYWTCLQIQAANRFTRITRMKQPHPSHAPDRINLFNASVPRFFFRQAMQASIS